MQRRHKVFWGLAPRGLGKDATGLRASHLQFMAAGFRKDVGP